MVVLKDSQTVQDAVREALNLTDEELEAVMGDLENIKLLIHDIKQADSDAAGEYSDGVVEAIINFILS